MLLNTKIKFLKNRCKESKRERGKVIVVERRRGSRQRNKWYLITSNEMKKRTSGSNIRERNKRMTHCDNANSPDSIPETTANKIK